MLALLTPPTPIGEALAHLFLQSLALLMNRVSGRSTKGIRLDFFSRSKLEIAFSPVQIALRKGWSSR